MFPIRDHNPSLKTPYVTFALIAANVLIFLAMLPAMGDERALLQIYSDWALVPGWVSNGQSMLGLVSSMFLHAGFLHVGGNMLFLWIFGDNLEEDMGHFGFLLFYLASGIGAGLVQVVADPNSMVPMVGASGAIAGVMGGYLLLYPRARVDVLFIFIIFFKVFPLPAWVMLGVWFGLQLINGASADMSAGGVAYWAHVGGFVVGLGLAIPLWLRRGGSGYWQSSQGHPEHAAAKYNLSRSDIPVVRRRRR
jgi:membrane associated rhomboid family serine protease